MIKKIILLGLMAFTTSISIGQQRLIDSLLHNLETITQNDTTAVILFNQLAEEYQKSSLDSTVFYLDKSMQLADSINFKAGLAKSNYLKGTTKMALSDLESAKANFSDALALYQELNDTVSIADCYFNIGLILYYQRSYTDAITNLKQSIASFKAKSKLENIAISNKYLGYIYSDMDNFEESLKHYDTALEINRNINNQTEIASCLNNIGILYADRSNYPLMAFKYYNESLAVAEKSNDSLGMLKALNNMGNLYSLRDNWDKAIINLERSLLIQKNLQLDNYIGVTLNNIGNNYKKLYNFEKAESYLLDAVSKSRDIKDLYGESAALSNLGGMYRAQKKNELARDNYYAALELKQKLGEDYGLSGVYVGLAYLHIEMKEFDTALEYSDKAAVIANRLNIEGLQRDVFDARYRIYKNTGNYTKALESFEQYKILNDSLFNKKNVEKLASIEYEYKYQSALDSARIRETVLNQKVISTTDSLERSQRNIFLTIIAFLATALLLGAVIFTLKLRNEKAKTQNVVIEQKLLRSQMTPHFIFNSLSVLQGMILNDEKKKSVSYLSKFSKLLRITLENSRDKMVPLEQELEGIKNYLDLQNLGANPPIAYSLDIDKRIDKDNIETPPMLIQPFIENAIEHAFPEKAAAPELTVNLAFKGQELICAIKDNGVGIDNKVNNGKARKKSLSTTITSERLAMLARDYKQKASVSISDRKKYDEQGTEVVLVIPFLRKA